MSDPLGPGGPSGEQFPDRLPSGIPGPPPPPASPFPSGVPTAGGAGSTATETIERFGRPMRYFPVAVSCEAMALAWANQEDGPASAVVVVDHEIGPRGYHGAIWPTPPADSLACSVILRPKLAVEEADSSWLAIGLIALGAAEAASGHSLSLWWPAEVVQGPSGPQSGGQGPSGPQSGKQGPSGPQSGKQGDQRELISAVKAEIQLGPGKVKSVVATMRFDLIKLGLGRERRDDLLEQVVASVDSVSELLGEGASAVAAAYEARCSTLGKRLMVKLRPKGETRGTVRSIDRSARLELASPTGMVERVGIDQMMELKVI